MAAAVGPDLLGCISDPQPCDISQYGCCPDGKTQANGDNFEGCSETLEVGVLVSAELTTFNSHALIM